MRRTIFHGPRSELRNLVLLLALTIGPLAAGLSSSLARRGRTDWAQAAFSTLLILTVAEALCIVIHLSTGVERAELSDEGIDLYGRTGRTLRRTIPWGELCPPSPPRLGFAALRWSEPGGYLRTFQCTVSSPILHGILLDERCPRWELPPSHLRRSDLPANWSQTKAGSALEPDAPESDAAYVLRTRELELRPSARATLGLGGMFLALAMVSAGQAYTSQFPAEYALTVLGVRAGGLLILIARRGYTMVREIGSSL